MSRKLAGDAAAGMGRAGKLLPILPSIATAPAYHLPGQIVKFYASDNYQLTNHPDLV